MGRKANQAVMPERVTGGMPVITTDHENIHDKLAFSASNKFTVANAAVAYLEIIVPAAKYVHMKPFSIQADGPKILAQLIEAPTLTTGATPVTTFNRNRVGTPPASGVVLKNNPTAVSAGTIIDQIYAGGGTGIGGTVSMGNNPDNTNEFVLKPSTTYVVKIANNGTAPADINVNLFWYEEDTV